MDFTGKITSGKLKEPFRLVCYGKDGVGKTDFASQSEDPIFICAEQGTGNFDVKRFPAPEFFKDILDMVDWMVEQEKKGGPKTLVIDTIDWMERMIDKQCEAELGKELSKVGFQGGFKLSHAKHADFIASLARLKKTNVIALAHAKVKTFQDPGTGTGYDKYNLSLRDDIANVWRQWADAVLYFDYETFKKSEDDRFAFGEGKRVMYTEERPGFHAKCRYPVPFQMRLDRGKGWKTFTDAVAAGEVKPEVLLKEIDELMVVVTDETKKKASVDYVKSISNDPRLLSEFKSKLVAIKNGVVQ